MFDEEIFSSMSGPVLELDELSLDINVGFSSPRFGMIGTDKLSFVVAVGHSFSISDVGELSLEVSTGLPSPVSGVVFAGKLSLEMGVESWSVTSFIINCEFSIKFCGSSNSIAYTELRGYINIYAQCTHIDNMN